MFKVSEQRVTAGALVVSILLHLSGAFLYQKMVQSGLLGSIWGPKIDALRREEPLEFELVDTPVTAPRAKNPQRSRLVSDRATVARDRAPKQSTPTELPRSEGRVEMKNILPQPSQDQPIRRTAANHRENTDYTSAGDFLLSQQAQRAKPSPEPGQWQREALLQPQFRNPQGTASAFGDISLSTWNWDYAPYLFALREKVYRHWSVPVSYFWGLNEGETRLRFKIMRDGSIRDLVVIDKKGKGNHESLHVSSVNAIKASAPFAPLPEHFPDPFLEITGSFYYPGLNRN